MPKPVFLSLDGLDGTGKSTQCRLLVDWLAAQKIPVTACTDPGGTALGRELRQLLLHRREHRMAMATEALAVHGIAGAAGRRSHSPRAGSRRGGRVGSVHVGQRGLPGARRRDVPGRSVDGRESRRLAGSNPISHSSSICRLKGRWLAAHATPIEWKNVPSSSIIACGAGSCSRRECIQKSFAWSTPIPDIETVQRVVRREVARLLIEKGWTVRAEG